MYLKELKKLNFLGTSKFEETKSKIVIRSKDRTTIQEQLEKYLKSKRIKFTQRKKKTELDITGSPQILIFKTLKAKGSGGLKFEYQFTSDLNDWCSGVEYKDLKSGNPKKLLQQQKKIVHKYKKN